MSDIAPLQLKPGDGALNLAQDWLKRAAMQQHWPARTAFSLQIAMDEALTNILSHGFAHGVCDTSSITLTLSSLGTLITLEIADNGVPFDPTQHMPEEPALSLDDAMPGGHGLRIMRHYLHDMHYAFNDGHNRLRLTVAQQ